MALEDVCVAIPFVKVDPVQNPNLKVKGKDDPAHAYLRAMVVAFASVRRFNPHVSLWLVTNEAVDSPFKEQLEQLGVVFKFHNFGHSPPVDFTKRFAASLYFLDALEVLTEKTNILIDPDILCIRSLRELILHTNEAAGVLPIDYAIDHDVNGLSRRQAGDLHDLLGEPRDAPVHLGGETMVLPRLLIPEIRIRCERAWALAIERNRANKSKFHTEEHILSFAIRGVPSVSIDRFVRRIWTAHRFRQVSGTEGELTLWHLPAEKDRGFARIYPSSVDKDSWFWTSSDAQFVKVCGQAMGLHHRSIKRLAMDSAGQIANWLRTRVRSLKTRAPQ